MVRGFFSGAFWGLLAGGILLVLAALVIEARRVPPVPEAPAPLASPVPERGGPAVADLAAVPAADTPPSLAGTPSAADLRREAPVLPGASAANAAQVAAIDTTLPAQPVPEAPPKEGGPEAVAPLVVLERPGEDAAPADQIALAPAQQPQRAPGQSAPSGASTTESPATLPAPRKGPAAMAAPELGAARLSPGGTGRGALPLTDPARAAVTRGMAPAALDPLDLPSAGPASFPRAPLRADLAGRDGARIAIIGTDMPRRRADWLLSILDAPGLPEEVEPVAAQGLDGIADGANGIALTAPARAADHPDAAVLYRYLNGAEDVTPDRLAEIAERARRDGQVALLVNTRRRAVLEPFAEWLQSGGGAALVPVPLSALAR